ncbi:sensor histidine kinase [Halobacterium sp. KA-6]|uniref:sensor histidine kinase n=1 Tax=Halobacterium sp. KA-6 TaxID=2896368 RepID=UPI001E48FC16|nr:HAMP domain-containing sensor histidine kinase [Halobacterium sp. KA-6]MCD2204472.1 HAMP domain-containing histidine kinase [Halobacterium sp. KA-6]
MSAFPLRSADSVPERLVATAVTLSVFVVVEGVVRLRDGEFVEGAQLLFAGEFLVGALTMAPFVVGIAYAGYWLDRSTIEPGGYTRIWWWTVAGTAASVGLNVALMTVLPVQSTQTLVAWLRWAVAVGAGLGVGIGVTEARAIQQATVAERNAVRAEHLEVQRDLLDYLNSLLRHEVLNAANVISGYADLLQAEHEEGTSGYDHSETIRRKSEEVTGVVQDVRVLLHATEERADFEQVDVVPILHEELEKLSDLDEDVGIETDLPESAVVHADALLPRVFGNVLANAVEHNDSDPPKVWVRGHVNEDTVTVDVEDNGPGLPEEDIPTLFERPSRRAADHGLGLYLVARLVEHYCGTVELLETSSEGSTFRITLPREPPEESTPSPFVDPFSGERAEQSTGDGQ